MSILIFFIAVVFVLWAVGRFYLKGSDLSRYDEKSGAGEVQSFPGPDGPSDGHRAMVAEVEAFGKLIHQTARKDHLALIRRYMDDQGEKREYDCEFRPVDVAGVPGEWVLTPGYDGSRRVLYIHGGAFIAGSPLSHRNITHRYSELCGAAVLAIDYRLMPEHRRLDSLEDCKTAYQWVLENGPDGAKPVEHLVVSGDSAGGNLSLALSGWVRDQGLRAPDAVIALSPLADSTFSGPSIVANMESDVMLGPLFSVLMKIPPVIRRWHYVFQNRIHPANPLVSPIFGDLSNLPPTLLQVSEAEMLLDDSLRYARKARAQGSPAVAQSWEHMMHVWHIFYPEVSEAGDAWEEIRTFIESTR